MLTGDGQVTNPFDTVATVQFTPPSGAANAKTVWAFYDGENTWRARVYLSEIGDWTWSSTCEMDAGLHGKSGKFQCEPSNLRGRLLRNLVARFAAYPQLLWLASITTSAVLS